VQGSFPFKKVKKETGMKDRMTGDYRVCVEEADAFLSVSQYCVSSIEDFLGGRMYPFAVNISFACELYLKAIMMRRSSASEYMRGHDLKTLFESLPEEDRKAIEQLYNKKCRVSLDKLLQESGKAFEDWRYALEKAASINVTGILAFSEALQNYVRTL
jgi:HEPN domain-containing protein